VEKSGGPYSIVGGHIEGKIGKEGRATGTMVVNPFAIRWQDMQVGLKCYWAGTGISGLLICTPQIQQRRDKESAQKDGRGQRINVQEGRKKLISLGITALTTKEGRHFHWDKETKDGEWKCSSRREGKGCGRLYQGGPL